jgi:hypothetical protein
MTVPKPGGDRVGSGRMLHYRSKHLLSAPRRREAMIYLIVKLIRKLKGRKENR